MKKIYIDKKNDRREIYIIEDENLVEVHIESKDKDRLGNIYLARVDKVLKGMEAGFIDIGFEKNGYLPITEIPNSSGKKIDELLVGGREILVQVVKEQRGEKGVKLTEKLEFAGKNLVYTPTDKRIGISKKIQTKRNRERLKTLVDKLELDGGVLFRTSSDRVSDSELEEELLSLCKIYKDLEREKNFLPIPRLLYEKEDLTYQIIGSDLELEEIVVNDKEEFKSLKKKFEILGDRIRFDGNFQANYNSLINGSVESALKRQVSLKNGGSLIIDQLEALTVVDVNSGGYTGDLSLAKTVVNLNMEASVEVAKQIRLRNLAGIILVDFVDMLREDDRDKVIRVLSEEFKKDFIRVNIIGFTKLGLLEITREKIKKSLLEELSLECENCFGIGRIREN